MIFPIANHLFIYQSDLIRIIYFKMLIENRIFLLQDIFEISVYKFMS